MQWFREGVLLYHKKKTSSSQQRTRTINVDAIGPAYRKYGWLEVVVVVKQKACRAEGVMNDLVFTSTRKRNTQINLPQKDKAQIRAFNKV